MRASKKEIIQKIVSSLETNNKFEAKKGLTSPFSIEGILNGNSIKLKIASSGDRTSAHGVTSSWFQWDKEKYLKGLSGYDFHVFVVEDSIAATERFLIFSIEELKSLINEKDRLGEKDHKTIHFYFHWDEDRVREYRRKETIDVDYSAVENNLWKL